MGRRSKATISRAKRVKEAARIYHERRRLEREMNRLESINNQEALSNVSYEYHNMLVFNDPMSATSTMKLESGADPAEYMTKAELAESEYEHHRSVSAPFVSKISNDAGSAIKSDPVPVKMKEWICLACQCSIQGSEANFRQHRWNECRARCASATTFSKYDL